MKTERRYLQSGASEMRVSVGAESRVITGYAAKFNSRSQKIGGMFYEQIAPGAFLASLEGDVRALFNHDSNIVLGRTSAGTLRLWEDAVGLGYEINPPDTQAARDLMVSIERGDVNQNSFCFVVNPGGDFFEEDSNGDYVRTLLSVSLLDISPVTYPAYLDTNVVVRSFNDWLRSADKKSTMSCAADYRARRVALAEIELKPEGLL